MYEESELEIEEIDVDQLSLYLGKHLSKEDVVQEALEDLLYTKEAKPKTKKVTKKIKRKIIKNKVKNKSKKINKKVMDKVFNFSGGADTPKAVVEVKIGNENDHKIVDNERQNDKDNSISKKKAKKTKPVWKKPKRSPTKIEERKMFGKALEILLTLCMDNHCYQFNNTIRVQNKGGPIGLKLTGEIFDCIMIDWDKRVLAELKTIGLIPELYTRFKDDITIVTESLEKGSQILE